MTNTNNLTARRDLILDERAVAWNAVGKPLADLAATRTLTAAESVQFGGAEATFAGYSERLAGVDAEIEQNAAVAEFSRHLAGGDTADRAAESQWINTDTGQPAAVRSDESFGSHPIARGASARGDLAMAQYENLGEMVRALATTGNGSATVPASWSSQLIDLARAKSAVTRAGAAIIPMDSKTVNIGRLTGDPTAAFRAENSAITSSDPTFDNVTLTSRTMSALVIGSLEWFQDADNADRVVKDAISKAIASQLDLAALYGGIIAGAGALNLPTPPNPRGILAALNATKPANVLGTAAANGTVQSAAAYWNEIIDLLFTVRDSNEEPNAVIWNSKAGRQYAKAVDTTGQPLNLPTDIESMQRLTSNNVPSYTLGTMASRATDVFAGDFTQLIIGQRLGITLQVLDQRYADTGQIGIMAHWRGDIQPARPSAFAVYRGIQGAA